MIVKNIWIGARPPRFARCAYFESKRSDPVAPPIVKGKIGKLRQKDSRIIGIERAYGGVLRFNTPHRTRVGRGNRMARITDSPDSRSKDRIDVAVAQRRRLERIVIGWKMNVFVGEIFRA